MLPAEGAGEQRRRWYIVVAARGSERAELGGVVLEVLLELVHPVSQRSGSAARPAYMPATSGCGKIRNRPSAIPAMTASATSSGMIAAAPSSFSIVGLLPSNIPVRTPIGQIACTVRPRCRCVSDSHSANASAPCLVTEYGADPGVASRPAADTVQIRCPLPRSSQPGSSSRAARTCAITLTSQESAQSASLASGPPMRAIPAFAQYKSISPSSALAASTSAATPSSDAASAGTATARPPPEASHDRATAVTAAAFRSLSTTLAPSAANRRASAAPMPLPAPVTTTPAPVTDSITDLRASWAARRGSAARPSWCRTVPIMRYANQRRHRGRPAGAGACGGGHLVLFPARPSLPGPAAAGLVLPTVRSVLQEVTHAGP